jgi:large subunit ribosomal protein L24
MKTKNKKIKHVKIGDQVKILTGNQKGLIGTILSLDKKHETAVIDSVKNRERYLSKKEKEREEEKQSTADEKKELPNMKEIKINIHISNLMLWDKTANLASRIGYKLIEKKKIRYFKKSGNLLS